MPMIRRQVSVSASPRAVWAALTTPEGLARWLSDAARVDGRAGGRIVLTPKGGGEESGLFHSFRPTAKVEINWDKRGEGPWKGSFLSFLVGRDGGETVVNVQHDGPAMDDSAARTALDEFWRARLNALRDQIEADPG